MKIIDRTKAAAREIKEELKKSAKIPQSSPSKGDLNLVTSTGSTLLDLAISGNRIHGGGLPSGILIEIYGPSGRGKTAILAEIMGGIQAREGEVMFLDPEARLDKEYAHIYGVAIDKSNYKMLDTVQEVFDFIENWSPKSKDKNVSHAIGVDSLAALSTDLELSDSGDTMGMKRAKEFSQGLRKICRLIKKNNWLLPCTNQIRQGMYGETTPGGKSVEFYSSLRIRVGSPKSNKFIIKKEKMKYEDERQVDVNQVDGIRSVCKITKNIIDSPHREADIYIMFGYGIDDIRGNLQYIKDMTGKTRYNCITKEYQSMERAIDYIEENNLESELKELTINVWEQVQDVLKTKRKPKRR